MWARCLGEQFAAFLRFARRLHPRRGRLAVWITP
jgi:hypothetical protein